MFGGKFNIGDLMKNASKMQEMMEKAQEELAKIEVSAEAGAGAVKVVMSAKYVVKSLDIDPSLLTEDKAVLEDLIIAAINNASSKAEEATKSQMSGISSLLGG